MDVAFPERVGHVGENRHRLRQEIGEGPSGLVTICTSRTSGETNPLV
jgi:hypothetical protein